MNLKKLIVCLLLLLFLILLLSSRNGRQFTFGKIRHGVVDGITVGESDAALLFFRHVLHKKFFEGIWNCLVNLHFNGLRDWLLLLLLLGSRAIIAPVLQKKNIF